MSFLKAIIKDKKHIITFIIIPIVAIMALCFVYSKIYVENIPFGVTDLDNSNLSRTIVQQLKNHPGLKVNYYTDSEADLENAIKEKNVYAGIVIPKDFNRDVIGMKSPSVAILINGTNMVIGSNALGYSSAVLGTLNAGIQLNIFQGKNMLPDSAKQVISTFSIGERILYETQLSYMRNLLYTIMPFVIQMFFMTKFIVPELIKKRQEFYTINIFSKEGMKEMLILLMRILIIITVAVISGFIALCMADKYYSLPLRGSVMIYAILMFIFLINLTAMGFVFAAFIDNMTYFLQFFGMLNLVLMLTCGIAWPEYVMPDGFFQVVKSIWPFAHIALPIKYLNLKGVGLDILMPYLKDGLLYTAVWMPIGIGLYSARIAFTKYKNKKDLDKNEDSDNDVLELGQELASQIS